MQHTDIDWAARIMIARHGEQAASAAQRRATHLLKRNDPDIAALWVRVERAVRAIQGRAIQGPPPAAGDEPARNNSLA
jgi:hypothetical protein